jgi:hypothetical protein
MSRYARPPNTSLYVRNVPDGTRLDFSFTVVNYLTHVEYYLFWCYVYVYTHRVEGDVIDSTN